jgi:hypothetical protein
MLFSYLKSNPFPGDGFASTDETSMGLLELNALEQRTGDVRFAVMTGHEIQPDSISVEAKDRKWNLHRGWLSIKLGMISAESEQTTEPVDMFYTQLPPQHGSYALDEINVPAIEINYIDGSDAADLLKLLTNPAWFVVTAKMPGRDFPMRLETSSTKIAKAAVQFDACMQRP